MSFESGVYIIFFISVLFSLIAGLIRKDTIRQSSYIWFPFILSVILYCLTNFDELINWEKHETTLVVALWYLIGLMGSLSALVLKSLKGKLARLVSAVIVVMFCGAVFVVFTDTGAGIVELFNNWKSGDPPIPANNEVVMPPNATIEATTKSGTVFIRSGTGLKRYYTWDGATRSAVMWPRTGRWYGSLGIYYPGPGFHWLEHKGVKRGLLDEGQQHFNSIREAVAWLKLPYHSDCVYRDDGLVACFSKKLDRYQLNVDVWQIYIEGKTQSNFKETGGDRIWVYDEKVKPEIFKNSKSTVYYVGGHKPTKLEGSNNDLIRTSWDTKREPDEINPAAAVVPRR